MRLSVAEMAKSDAEVAVSVAEMVSSVAEVTDVAVSDGGVSLEERSDQGRAPQGYQDLGVGFAVNLPCLGVCAEGFVRMKLMRHQKFNN